jgi:hypothetical protein
MKEMNGSQPFVYISTCGCVFSQAGLRTLTSSKEKGKEKEGSTTPTSEASSDIVELCPNCATKYTKVDVVLVNPDPEEQDTLRFALERKRAQEPAKKKSKKRKNESDEADPPKKKQGTASSGVTATSRAVATELEQEEVKRKATMSVAVKSLYGNSSTRTETFMTRTFTRVRFFQFRSSTSWLTSTLSSTPNISAYSTYNCDLAKILCQFSKSNAP